jgi:CheY-like chemotaxis protein
MEGPDRSPWFAGDLDDPWVVAIADALPRAFRLDCPGDLPDSWPVAGRTPAAVVVHRSTLIAADALRLGRLRARWAPAPRLILCVGPHARYADVERWARLVDAVIPEATAPDSVGRQARERDRPPRPGGAGPRVAVVSTNHELRAALAEACRTGGLAAESASELDDAFPGLAVAWDVPVLEPDWPARLARRAKSSPVVALLGFADRATVAMARSHGASACLDLPCDLADLVDALDRVAASRPRDPAHEVPPAPLGSRAGASRKL